MFNRYSEGMTFGLHVDGGVRIHPYNGRKVRTDLSATLFLSTRRAMTAASCRWKTRTACRASSSPPATWCSTRPTSVHRVTPITRGVRVACFFWVQSLVRDAGDRALLFDMDNAIQRLNQTGADESARRTLTGAYHNLLRKWSDT